MKKIFVLLFFCILTLMSCSKKKDNTESTTSCEQSGNTYSDNSGTNLNLTKQVWYLERIGTTGGSVNLSIQGSINGDSAAIRTIGDGLIYNAKLQLSSGKSFNQDVQISFTVRGVEQGDFNATTVIYVYRNNDVLQVNLESCTLSF